jgi:hypothetical protein
MYAAFTKQVGVDPRESYRQKQQQQQQEEQQPQQPPQPQEEEEEEEAQQQQAEEDHEAAAYDTGQVQHSPPPPPPPAAAAAAAAAAAHPPVVLDAYFYAGKKSRASLAMMPFCTKTAIILPRQARDKHREREQHSKELRTAPTHSTVRRWRRADLGGHCR